MKPRIIILDTYYPEAIRSMPINPAMTYQSNLDAILYQSFGTFDAYSRNLRALGWEAEDCIWNHDQLNNLAGTKHFLLPDVLFLQDLSIEIQSFMGTAAPIVIAAQCSCPWPGDDNIRKCDVIFTSFPHYVTRIEALGVKAVYNPLAFDPIVIQRVIEQGFPQIIENERPFDVTFIGGVGNPGHWRRGMETLNAVAEAIPTFKWWGYGADLLPSNSALRQKYQGEAWGLNMYRVMLQSKIVLNRHGEVAEGYSNNMRMFEATGCGALLITEKSDNLRALFEKDEALSYGNAEEAVERVNAALHIPNVSAQFARNGQSRTLQDHTYAHRMKTVSDTLLEMLK